MNRLLIFLLIALHVGCSSKKETPPNVVFILTDQWRASALGYSGNKDVLTPHLDEFARSAVNFKNTVTVVPVCTPYRAALLTGKYPTTTGMFINDIYLPEQELTMAEIYQDAGYNTGYIGKWHLDGHGRHKFVAPERRQGFSYWKGSECDHNHIHEHYYHNADTTKQHWDGYSTFAIVDDARQYIRESAKSTDPFLLFVSLSTPHFPHKTALEEYLALYDTATLQLPANVPPEMKSWAMNEIIGYYAHCTATDKAIGDLIREMKDSGIYENTIIVFTSDHGEMMGSHGYRPYMKHQPYLESANVPFLISYPAAGIDKGLTADAPITTPDILPTLLSLSGIDIPPGIEGYDLASLVKDPNSIPDRTALFMDLCPTDIAFHDDEFRAIKTADYTYVKNPEGPSLLFHDREDSLQMNNLIGNPVYADVQNKLDEQLMNELRRIGEMEIHPRVYYTKKFGFEGRKEIRDNYAIKDYFNVINVISPEVN